MSDKRDPPIEATKFVAGVNVVDIGEVRVARGLTRRHRSTCPHNQLMYDNIERRVWCADCEQDVEPYDAFVRLVEHFDHAQKAIERRQKELTEAESANVIALATKHLDKAWRSRRMVPACPHCGNGLFPEDFKCGVGNMLGREFAEAQRNRGRKK